MNQPALVVKDYCCISDFAFSLYDVECILLYAAKCIDFNVTDFLLLKLIIVDICVDLLIISVYFLIIDVNAIVVWIFSLIVVLIF